MAEGQKCQVSALPGTFWARRSRRHWSFSCLELPECWVRHIAHRGTAEDHYHGWRGLLAPAAMSLARCPSRLSCGLGCDWRLQGLRTQTLLCQQSQAYLLHQFTSIYGSLHSYKIFHSEPFVPLPFMNTIFPIIVLTLAMSLLPLLPKSLLHLPLSEGQSDQTCHLHFSSCLEFSLPQLPLYQGQKVSSTTQLSFCSCLISNRDVQGYGRVRSAGLFCELGDNSSPPDSKPTGTPQMTHRGSKLSLTSG